MSAEMRVELLGKMLEGSYKFFTDADDDVVFLRITDDYSHPDESSTG